MLLLLLACTPDPVALDAPGDTAPPCDAEADLEAVRAATEVYADVQAALEAGYVPQADCDVDDAGAAMGIHYVLLPESLDQEHVLLEPEILLYVPEGDGVRLVGVEYVRPALLDGEMLFGEEEPTGGTFDPAPSMFCRPFDGPMAGHVPQQPWHYDLHLWLFSENPDGVFAQYNPEERCDG